jgi:hypothetical protein
MTEWRTIPGFSRYDISEYGQIRCGLNAKKIHKAHLKPGQLLVLGKDEQGYLRCWLRSDQSNVIRVRAHQMVALAFCGPRPSKKHFALHWDDNPINNHYSNIRWGTQKQNIDDAYRNGHVPCGEDHHQTLLTNKQVREIRRRFPVENRTLKSFGKEFGVSLSCISGIIKGKRWKRTI